MIEGTSGIISFIGIGANEGRPVAQCLEAIERMHAAPGVRVLRRSSLYRSEPVGLREQDWFVNAVVEIRTVLQAGELMQVLQAIESVMGRERDVRWGPRVIDLDIFLSRVRGHDRTSVENAVWIRRGEGLEGWPATRRRVFWVPGKKEQAGA